MALVHVSGHHGGGNDVILEGLARIRFRDPGKNPEEVFTKVSFCLHAYTARSVTGNESFHLDVNKPRAFKVTAQNVSVRRVAKCYHSGITAAAKLASDKKLAGVSTTALLFV